MTGRGLSEAYLAVLAVALSIGGVVIGLEDPRGRTAAGLALVCAVALAGIAWSRRRRGPQPVRNRRGGVNDYWWVGVVVPPGITTWLTFLYLAWRLRRRALLFWSLLYFALAAAAVATNLIGHDEDQLLGAIAVTLWLTVYLGGMIHAYALRHVVRAADVAARSGSSDGVQPRHGAAPEAAGAPARPGPRPPFTTPERNTLAVSFVAAFGCCAIGMPLLAVAALVPASLALRNYDRRVRDS
jgi:hypothetical protein